MDNIFSKLRLKPEHKVLILNAPKSFNDSIKEFNVEFDDAIGGKYDFIQDFEIELAKAQIISEDLINALNDEGLLWVCYPKGSSKNFKSDINRTKIWGLFGKFEFEPVSQISIDDDWSTVRFRHVDKIKSLTRKIVATEKGKIRIKDNK